MDLPYGSQPLIDTLGIRKSFRIGTVNAPAHYQSLLVGLPKNVRVMKVAEGEFDMIHFFTTDRDELRELLPRLKNAIRHSGSIWVSWPKNSSGMYSSVDAHVIRDVCLPMGLVDIKICSVDDVWTALKLVIRVEHRR